MTVGQAYSTLCERLAPQYGAREAASVALRFLGDAFELSRVDLVLRAEEQLPDDQRFEECIGRLEVGEPVQYVVGFEEFLGRHFSVTPDVLIPRPETEEIIVKLLSILNKNEKYTIYDIGTGSGAIAISLAAELPKATVSASDISPKALDIAKANAKKMGVKVTFWLDDIFAPSNISNKYDIIISNPPYVTELERSAMCANVTDHEPSTALYVPNEDPTRYYIAITNYAIKALNNDGRLIFEINERYSAEVTTYMASCGFKDVVVCRDFNGKDRMVWATK